MSNKPFPRTTPIPIELWELEDICVSVQHNANRINQRINFNNHVMGRELDRAVENLQRLISLTLAAITNGSISNNLDVSGTDISAYSIHEAVFRVYLESFRCIQLGLNQPNIGDMVQWIPIYITYQNNLLTANKWIEETYFTHDQTKSPEIELKSPHIQLSELTDVINTVEDAARQIQAQVQSNGNATEARILQHDISELCLSMGLMVRQVKFDCSMDASIPEFFDEIEKGTINPKHENGVDLHIRADFVNTALRRMYMMSFECLPVVLGDLFGRLNIIKWISLYRQHQTVLETAIRWLQNTYGSTACCHNRKKTDIHTNETGLELKRSSFLQHIS